MKPSKFQIGDRVTNRTCNFIHCVVTGVVEGIFDGDSYSPYAPDDLVLLCEMRYGDWRDGNMVWVRLDVPVPKYSLQHMLDKYGAIYRKDYILQYYKYQEKITNMVAPEDEFVSLSEAASEIYR